MPNQTAHIALGTAAWRGPRLPVIDGKRMVGLTSQADIVTNVDPERVGEFVEAISGAC